MFTKKILIDLDGVLNEYGKEKFDESFIPDIKDGAFEFIKNFLKYLYSLLSSEVSVGRSNITNILINR